MNTFEEAMREIERLRAALQNIIECWALEDDSVNHAISRAAALLSANRQ
jgi:hypothetical protein